MNHSFPPLLIGIDVGGTKTSICLGNTLGTILRRRKVKTPPHPEEGLSTIREMIFELLREDQVEPHHIQAVGCSLPGLISIREGMVVRSPNLPLWVDVPIARYLSQTFRCPIFLNNDGNGGALAEWTFGHHTGIHHLIYLTMSTGMGGGIIKDGLLWQGGTDTAGEIGHCVLDPEGPLCVCGQKGCFEVYCGGYRMIQSLREDLSKDEIDSEVLALAGGDIGAVDMKCLIEAVKREDRYAIKKWEQFIKRLAQGIGILLMVLNPDLLVLGTMARYASNLLFAPLVAQLKQFSWPRPLHHCQIVESQLGEQVGDLGSLAIAIQGLSRHRPVTLTGGGR